jgi:S-adenosylmethionine-dependent methyltransferase
MTSRGEQEAAIRRFYDSIVEKEHGRLHESPFELAVTLRFIRKYLRPGMHLLDVACGTGRYAEALLDAGFCVGAGDLADANVRVTKALLGRAGDFGDRLRFVRQGNALDPSAYAGGPWDGILLLGPCYHLPDRSDRIAVLKQARAHLRSGGRVYAGFVSRIAPFWWGLQHRPEGILEADGVRSLLASGSAFNFAAPGTGLPHGYFCDPSELDGLFGEAGLVVEHLCGTEAVFGGRVSSFHQLEKPLQEAWLKVVTENCEAPVFVWASEHLLVVAKAD